MDVREIEGNAMNRAKETKRMTCINGGNEMKKRNDVCTLSEGPALVCFTREARFSKVRTAAIAYHVDALHRFRLGEVSSSHHHSHALVWEAKSGTLGRAIWRGERDETGSRVRAIQGNKYCSKINNLTRYEIPSRTAIHTDGMACR
jgi:hypothetical protein